MGGLPDGRAADADDDADAATVVRRVVVLSVGVEEFEVLGELEEYDDDDDDDEEGILKGGLESG